MSILAMQVNASNDLLCTHALLGAYLLTTHTYEHMRLLTRVYIQYMIGTVIHVASMPLYCAYCSKLWYMFLDPKSLSFFPAHHFSILFVDLLRASNVHGTREVYAELWIFFFKDCSFVYFSTSGCWSSQCNFCLCDYHYMTEMFVLCPCRCSKQSTILRGDLSLLFCVVLWQSLPLSILIR